MRVAWPIIVGIALLNCKDEQRSPAKSGPPPGETTAPAPGTPAPPPTTPTAAPSAPAIPRLDPAAAGSAFDAEVEDKDWAINTERAIKALAPDLKDVDCKQRQCRATLVAESEADLVAKTDKLSEEDGLRGTPNAKHVLLTAPTQTDGKFSMQIYVQYDR